MKGRALGQTKDVDCLTRNEVKVVKLTESSQTFYCIYYEKRTGNLNEFDVLSFDLSSDDYDFKFVRKIVNEFLSELEHFPFPPTLDWSECDFK